MIDDADIDAEEESASEVSLSRASRLAIVASTGHRLECPVGRSFGITLCVVEGDGGHLATSPYNERTDGCKDDAYEKKGGKDGFGCEDRLPSLETLLLEGGIWYVSDTQAGCETYWLVAWTI